ncbi:hypothetical protein ONE63_005546 [Megalurothrips usitatus]|uniref:Uncharacterized protein n=1 Tax=Megalurothrips usitatus TaxID=439358 RepID=A0AAV7XVU2_9NEOP|nr:hypothetical protein ONE63_005546 [Megalurothrips usitatus]
MVWIMSCSRPCLNLVPGGPEDEEPPRAPEPPDDEPPAPLPPPTLVVLDVVGFACCNKRRGHQ